MKVSIIVPVYNDEKNILRCVESLIKQTHKNLEIILVNDGSTDHTLSNISQFAELDPRIVIIDQENSGTHLARLAGINKSTGEAIINVDSDDYLETNAVELLVKKMQVSDADIVIGNYFQHRDGIKRLMVNSIPVISSKLNLLKYLLLGKLSIYIWGRLIKRHLLEDLELPIKRAFSEDVLTNFFIFSNYEVKLAKVDEPILNYVIHKSNISYSNEKVPVEGFFNEFEIVEEMLEIKGLKNKLKEELSLYKSVMWIGYCRKGGYKTKDPKYRKQFYDKNYPLAKKYLPLHTRLEMFLYSKNIKLGQQFTNLMFWVHKYFLIHKIIKTN